MGTLFLKLIQAEKQLLKGFTNLKLKHDILEVKILIFSLPENITFTFWNISCISILVWAREPVSPTVPVFSNWAERSLVILARIKADVFQKGGESNFFKCL